jgi:hypothetical protein
MVPQRKIRYVRSVSAKPVHRGIRTLSFTGNGRYSTIMATAAPTRAIHGDTKNEPARKAKKNPPSDPCKVFALLKGRGLPDNMLPISEAVLSPKAKIAMAAPLARAGKSNKVNSMPTAK